MIKKTFLPLLCLLTIGFSCTTEKIKEQENSSFQSFSLKDVQLLPGIFKNAQEVDLAYMMELDPDRLLAPYLTEAGLPTKKESYANWENTGLDGHIGGHYLTALSQMLVATGDTEVNRRLDYMLETLKECQDKIGTGYLGGSPGSTAVWEDIAKGNIQSDNFELNGKWVPTYNLHKLFAGLRDAYLIAEKPLAKQMLIRLTDYVEGVANQLTDEQIQKILVAEHGGINEVFADVSVITGDDKYLKLARRFSHRLILDPLSKEQDPLTGMHANTQIPKVVGFQRIAGLDHNEAYANASRFFWQTVTENRSIVLGGNSVQEHFNPVDDYSKIITDIAGPETCNTYNMLKLSKGLFESEGKAKYLDYYERGLYNHILSSQHPERGGFVYYTPMRPQHYRVYSQPDQCMWCCVGSGMENRGTDAELIYSHRNSDLYVNLLIPSKLNWLDEGIVISQQTNFPDEPSTEITIEEVSDKDFNIFIRNPHWVVKDQLTVRVNDEETETLIKDGPYIQLNRKWQKGDKIEITLPMQLTVESLPTDPSYVAFLHGPIVLGAITGTDDLDNLIGDSIQWEGYRARGKEYPLETAPLLIASDQQPQDYLKSVPDQPQTFTLADRIKQEQFKDLELIPFYKLHDARYMLYWKVEQP